MGLAKKYCHSPNKTHIPRSTEKSLTGTVRFASLHSHNGEELSRRDDFISIGYLIVLLFTGNLPWNNIWCENKEDRYKQIKNLKENTSNLELCKDCPH